MTQAYPLRKHTPGPWEPGCITSKDSKCMCPHIFDGGYSGGIGKVYVDNGIGRIEDGANDCPPLEEAIANAHMFAAAPDMAGAIEGLLDFANWLDVYLGTSSDLSEEKQELNEKMRAAEDALLKAAGKEDK